MTKKELFANIGILPPKGVLMYGPPGFLILNFGLQKKYI
jgi:SpoVK/Ycf46/Vps4 family AAA+-type ATPase